MKHIAICIVASAAILQAPLFAQQKFAPPVTKKSSVADTLHGKILADPYRWLEDKQNPEVVEWTKKQNDATLDYIAKNTREIPGLRDELAALIDRDVIGAPFFRGNRQFYTARRKGEQQSKLYTRIDGKDILIFDPMKYDPSGKSSISGMSFTRNGEKLAIGLQSKGSELNVYRIINTRTGEMIGDTLQNVNGFSWTLDERRAYVHIRSKELIEAQKPLPTYLYDFRRTPVAKKFLFQPDDAKNSMWIYDTDEGDLTVHSSGDFYSNTVKIGEYGSEEPPKLAYSSKKFKAFPEVRHERIFWYTNDNAPNYKIMVSTIEKPEYEHWSTFVPEKETMLEGFEITSDYVIVQDKKDVMSRLFAYDLDGKLIKQIELPEFGNVSGTSYHKESNTVFVTLSTFTAPAKVYKLDGKSLEWEFFYQDKPPVDTKNIEGKIVFYKSSDGARVPMFIIHRKDVKLDGSNPAMLYGYGGFNNGISPHFVGGVASFVNRGGVYAIAGIRGGDEYGEKWHQDGMLHKKQNTFNDFIAAAEFLIAEKYTNAGRLAVKGGSNGGLLIGAFITQRPELCKIALCQVPLLDMVRFHKFLIARYWIPEYGDPEKKEDFEYILGYSPYHNVKAGVNYPTTIVTCGENDVRVDPLHAKKFVAALQNNPGQKNPVMLQVNYDSGHGSGKSTAQLIDESTREWQWVMNELGMAGGIISGDK